MNLLLVDLIPRPLQFSFAKFLSEEFQLGQSEATPAAPIVSSYRVDGRASGAPLNIGAWIRPCAVGNPLPKIPLALNPITSIMIDLEPSYRRATKDCYLS